ncbi:hypothetical protein PHET_11327 [Paragonimus heterotremus]|uniref:Uncharacterized protein n=1 Tax=Paragonimus heterotremus TaxID=100268 RepID=A0A8J4WDS9_9TREM|nr:hypothetical protein PHET_11327 [Paragonimus heterotremus]
MIQRLLYRNETSFANKIRKSLHLFSEEANILLENGFSQVTDQYIAAPSCDD